MQKKVKKVVSALLAIGTFLSPISAYAEEEAISSAEPTTEVTESEDTESDTIVETDDGQLEITMPSEDEDTFAVETTEDDTKAQSVVDDGTALTDEQIKEQYDGENAVAVYHAINQEIQDEINSDETHLRVKVSGNGYLELSTSDGEKTAYRWDTTQVTATNENGETIDTEVVKLDDDGNVIEQPTIDESTATAEEMLKYQEELETYNNADISYFIISGENGETLTANAVADNNEMIAKMIVQDLTSATSGDTNVVVDPYDENEQTQANTDVQLETDSYKYLTVTFTSDNANTTVFQDGVTPISTSLRTSNLSSFLSGNENGNFNAVSYTAINRTSPGYTHPAWNDSIILYSTDNATLNEYINKYKNETGNYPILKCQSHGDCGPRDGMDVGGYFKANSYSMYVYVNFAALFGTSVYGAGYFGNTGRLQSMAGTFETKPDKHDAKITIKKSAKQAYLMTQYSDYYSLAGAEYTMYRDSNCTQKVGETIVIGKDGTGSYTFKDITDSYTIYIKETKAPTGFELDSTVYTASLGDTVSIVSSVDSVKYGTVRIKKLDSNDNEVIGAKLKLTNLDTNTVEKEWATSELPQRINVVPGHYKIEETYVPDGYYQAKPVEIEVLPNASGTQTFSMTDAPLTYKVKKIDKSSKEDVSGVVLELQNANGSPLERWTTDGTEHTLGTGELLNGWSGKLRCNTQYRIHEVSVPNGYEKLLDDVVFTTSEYEPTDSSSTLVTVGNTSLNYAVLKVDAETGAAVKGAKLALKDSNGDTLVTWTSTGNKYTIPKKYIKLGQTYTITELSAPTGYYKSGTDMTFTIENTGGVEQLITFKDYKTKVQIIKTDGETQDKLVGVKLAIYEKGSNKQIDSWTTDGSYHVLSGVLENGKTYEVRELATIKGYYLDTSAKEFTLSETYESTNRTVSVTFTDKPIHVKFAKYDTKQGKFLAGATMQITDKNGNVIKTFQSDGSTFTELDNKLFEVGQTYYIEETKAPSGYYKASDSEGNSKIAFTIPKTWQDAIDAKVTTGISVEAIDYKIAYKVSKVDDNGSSVSGAHMGLYKKGSTKMLEDWTTSNNAYNITTALEAGQTYVIKELEAPDGYYKIADLEFTVSDTLPEDTLKSGVTVTVKEQPVVWYLTKQDKNGKTLQSINKVPFVFNIYDSNGTKNNTADDTLIMTLNTNDSEYKNNGKFELKDLIEGTTYRVEEASCPNGYSKASDQYFTVSATAPTNTSTITMVDDEYHVKFQKVDNNKNLLTTYEDNSEQSYKAFSFELYDTANPSKVVYSFSTDDYDDSGWVDITNYCIAGHTYKIVETEYPYGYYKAKDGYFTCPSSGTVSATMTDPTISARFRKLDTKGNVLKGDFEFTVYDKATGKAVALLSLKDADSSGYVSFGSTLKENTTYLLKETKAAKGYALAKGYIKFTTPSYYSGVNEVTNYCIIKNGDTSETCTSWDTINK